MVPAPTANRWNPEPHESVARLERALCSIFAARTVGLRNGAGYLEVVALPDTVEASIPMDHIRTLREESVGVPARDLPHYGLLVGCDALSTSHDHATVVVRVVCGDRRTLEKGLFAIAEVVHARTLLIVSGAATNDGTVGPARLAELQRLADLGVDVEASEIGLHEVLAMTLFRRTPTGADIETWLTPRDRFEPEHISDLPAFVHQEIDAAGEIVPSADVPAAGEA